MSKDTLKAIETVYPLHPPPTTSTHQGVGVCAGAATDMPITVYLWSAL